MRVCGYCDDPWGDDEEWTMLFTDKWGTDWDCNSSKSIHCYQNQALNRHCTGNGWKKKAYLAQGLIKWITNMPSVSLLSTRFRGNRNIGNSRFDMAIFPIIKFISFLKVGVLKTIIAMREFPINETTSIKLKATVCTSFSTTGFTRLERLQELGSFALCSCFPVAVKASSRKAAVQTKLV